MARVPIPPVKLPWREKDIQSGDHKLLADYLKVLVKSLQKRLEEIGNIVNINDKYNTGDMLKADYDPDNDGKVENADHADNADFATNSDKVDNKDATDFINIDGSTSPTTDIDWGGHKITNLGSPTDILDAVNEEYLAKAVSTIGSRYYMTDDDSGIEDYKLCSINPSSSSEQSISITDVVDGQYIGGWISPNTGEPSKLLTGVFNWRVYVEKTGGNKTLRLYWKLVERKSDNSEVVIGTSIISNEIITEKNSYIIPLTLSSDYEIASDSYIVGKIYASVTGNGNNPSLKIYYQGNSASHFQIPVNTEILDNRFLSKEVYDPDGDDKVENADHADNADKVDNFDASQTPQANTIPVAGSNGKLDEGWLPDTSSSAEDVSYDNTNSGLVATNVQNAIDEVDNEIDKIKNGTTTVGNADHANNADNATNADKLNNQNSSYYTNASNLNAGIVPRARLDGTYDIDITGDAQTLQGKSPSDFASSTHTHILESLSNVTISSPTNGQVLGYQDGIWENVDVYYVCPEDYGAIGDGSHDDSSAFQDMFDAIQNKNVIIVLGAKQYKLTRQINVNINKSLKILGCGIETTKLYFSSLADNYGFYVTLGSDVETNLTLQDFSILTALNDTSKMAFYIKSNSDQSDFYKLFVDKIQLRGSSPPSNGWGTGFYLKNINNTCFSRFCFVGKGHYNNKDLIPDSICAICYDGADIAATGHYIDTSFIWIVDKAVQCKNHIEGFHINLSELVAVNYGLETSNLTGLRPLFNVINSHISARKSCLYLKNIAQSQIVGNLFYSREYNAENYFIGVYLIDCQTVQVCNNNFAKNHHTNFWGIIIEGSNSNYNFIGHNIFQASGDSGYDNGGIWFKNGTGAENRALTEDNYIWYGSFNYKILDQR